MTTRMDQVDNLLEAREAEPDWGFMARMLALCSLPRTDPGARTYYKRVNGPYRLFMNAGTDNKLPYGSIPRLLLAWVATEAVRTGKRELGVDSDSGGKRGDMTRFRNQMMRLFGCTVSLVYEGRNGFSRVSSLVADRHEFWWDPKQPGQSSLWESRIELGEKFFNEIVRNPVPIDMNVLKALKRSPLGLDLYLWLNYRTFSLEQPLRLSWKSLYRQFGRDLDKASDKYLVMNFRNRCLRELGKIETAWPTLACSAARGVLIVAPSRPVIEGGARRIGMPSDHRSSRPFHPHAACDLAKFSPLKRDYFFAPVSAETGLLRFSRNHRKPVPGKGFQRPRARDTASTPLLHRLRGLTPSERKSSEFYEAGEGRRLPFSLATRSRGGVLVVEQHLIQRIDPGVEGRDVGAHFLAQRVNAGVQGTGRRVDAGVGFLDVLAERGHVLTQLRSHPAHVLPKSATAGQDQASQGHAHRYYSDQKVALIHGQRIPERSLR